MVSSLCEYLKWDSTSPTYCKVINNSSPVHRTTPHRLLLLLPLYLFTCAFYHFISSTVESTLLILLIAICRTYTNRINSTFLLLGLLCVLCYRDLSNTLRSSTTTYVCLILIILLYPMVSSGTSSFLGSHVFYCQFNSPIVWAGRKRDTHIIFCVVSWTANFD